MQTETLVNMSVSDRNDHRLPRVAVLVDTSTGWGRRLIRGAARYAERNGPWQLFVEPRGRTELMWLPKNWAGDGIIARVSSQELADSLRSFGCPVVNVSGLKVGAGEWPCVTTNHAGSARLALTHFLDRGNWHFGYVGPTRYQYVRVHADAFSNAVEAHGAECNIFRYEEFDTAGTQWSDQQEALGDWLEKMPKPIGVFCWSTSAGARAIEICRERGVRVPDEVAVLAGDDDPLICNCTQPPMSAVLVASEQIGFHAAAHLARLMQGEESGPSLETIEPITVTCRGSTDSVAIADPDLRQALEFIRRHAFEPIRIDNIIEVVSIARRSLERKFQKHFGRSPSEEIRRIRIAKARELLALTDKSVYEISFLCGYSSQEHFATVFKRSEGLSPLRFRSQVLGECDNH